MSPTSSANQQTVRGSFVSARQSLPRPRGQNLRDPIIFANRSWRVRFAPIVVILAYLGITILLFVTGPLDFPIKNPLKLYLFLISVHVSLFLGYCSGISSPMRAIRRRVNPGRLVWWGSIATLVLFFPTSAFRTGSWLPDIRYGLTSPDLAYQDSLLIRETSQAMVEYVRIFAGPLLVMVLPLTVFYWQRLTWRCRIVGTLASLSTVTLFLGMATNKAIADTVLLMPILLVAGVLAGQLHLSKKALISAGVGATLLMLAFLLFFSHAVAARQGSAIRYNYFVPSGGHVDPTNVWIRNSGQTAAGVILGLDFYLTPGYYALSLALDEPFVPMFGIGNSMFLFRQASRLLNDPSIETMSYPFRIERHGWDAMRFWSSIYPWLASDFSFPGVIIIVFAIGRLFALSWKDTLQGSNPIAVTIFAQFVIMLFYFPANNQLLQSGEGFTAFWVTLILWLRSRRRTEPTSVRITTPVIRHRIAQNDRLRGSV